MAPDQERRTRVRIALALSLIVHVLLYIAIRLCATPHPIAHPGAAAIRLRLIDAAQRTVIEPLPPEPVPTREQVRRGLAGTGPDAPLNTARNVRGASGRALPEAKRGGLGMPDSSALFDADGRPRLPAPVEEPVADRFASTLAPPRFAADPLAHRRILRGRATRFERKWIPDGETLAGEWLRKGTFEKHWDTRGGNRIQCVLVVVIPACLWGWAPRVTIEELQAMRADPPMPHTKAFPP